MRLVLPVEEMDLLARGAVGDLKSMAGTLKGKRGKRNGLRPVRSAVPVRAGKGTRRNPFRHAIKRRNRNGEQERAERLYQDFHGRAPSETLSYASEERSREWLGGLGQLVSVKYLTATNYDAETAFGDNAPMLAASPDGQSLYIVGGDQRIDLEAIEMNGAPWLKDWMVVGLLVEVTYQTGKHFHAFELVDYYHELGEETGVCPLLVLDRLNNRLLIVGGQYQVRPEGITN